MELVTASPEPGQHVPEPQGLVVAEGRHLQQAWSNGLMLPRFFPVLCWMLLVLTAEHF